MYLLIVFLPLLGSGVAVAPGASACYLRIAPWISSEMFDASWGFFGDLMLIVVTSISSLVHIYSISYMSEDPHSPRFMCYLSILTFFMPMLVTGDNSLQLFLGWEGVGLASYLLIHFWFTRLQADKAAIKAMPVNRVGDFGLAPGISGRFTLFQTVDFSTIFACASAPRNSWISCNMRLNAITLICILLLIGAVGKSAQIGSHTWSPDAMEGPTPVSALIHAATMVTAGVFMIARCSPLFEYPPTALIVITFAGATTSFLAATTGILQNDLKRVIAYSTCSQLGYMIFACGISNYSALKRRTGTSGINVFQFLALHRPSNGPWTKRPLPERTMSRGPPPPPHTRYISRLWAAKTIQEDTRNWKDKQTHPVDCRATSSTTQERDSLKSQGRGWPRGPTWRLGISAGNAKVA
ncbi:hypothetical protein PVK06_049921 [Gossypium arboreum]|uniref:NADH-ubiquinone oxidoreductase chain 5 n=1 Tax=Gossypium arboreum TaxID=29729 RepID=A0ABR0M9F5_GOSAR|nr:hypothetical protein PVK06_049921 [Gossypium arboreum]